MKKTNKHITELLIRTINIDVSKYDDSFLNNSLQKRISETLCSSEEDYFILLEQNSKEREIFIDSLQISYTEFFRNTLTFAVLENIVLPGLIQKIKNSKRREIRIWSAACATGQEAYSLAMLFEEQNKGDANKFDYRIFATDQSETQIDEAKKGEYHLSALNNLTMKRLDEWFTKHDDTYTIKPELKAHIDFSVFDLLNGQYSSPPASIFGDFDLIVCANLLFYYKPEFRKRIFETISSSLVKDGYLVTGEAESKILTNYYYYEVFPQSAILRIKNNFQK